MNIITETFRKDLLSCENNSPFNFSIFKVNSCIRNAAICCDRNYRKMKIASKLLESVKSVSNEKFLRGESTNDISYNILLRQGWKKIYEINFQDYRDENGKVIFNTQYPNTHLRLVIYKV